jgi:hypothetical protein
MPLEIRELQIKVTVDQPQGQGSQQDGSSGQPQDKSDKESVINQCIEQVMEILNKSKER